MPSSSHHHLFLFIYSLNFNSIWRVSLCCQCVYSFCVPLSLLPKKLSLLMLLQTVIFSFLFIKKNLLFLKNCESLRLALLNVCECVLRICDLIYDLLHRLLAIHFWYLVGSLQLSIDEPFLVCGRIQHYMLVNQSQCRNGTKAT